MKAYTSAAKHIMRGDSVPYDVKRAIVFADYRSAYEKLKTDLSEYVVQTRTKTRPVCTKELKSRYDKLAERAKELKKKAKQARGKQAERYTRKYELCVKQKQDTYAQILEARKKKTEKIVEKHVKRKKTDEEMRQAKRALISVIYDSDPVQLKIREAIRDIEARISASSLNIAHRQGVYVYAYTFPDKTAYVGKSTDPVQRHEAHLNGSHNVALRNALEKYRGRYKRVVSSIPVAIETLPSGGDTGDAIEAAVYFDLLKNGYKMLNVQTGTFYGVRKYASKIDLFALKPVAIK